jgi:hypothetical protein
MKRHGFLLGSLILGCTIIVWLAIIGLMVTAVAITQYVNEGEYTGPGSNGQPALVTDIYGTQCPAAELSTENVCR